MRAVRARGFTLIELMTGLTVIGLLVMLGFPAFSTMLQNQRLRATTEALLNALQNARTEAVKRNVQVDFVMFNDAIDVLDSTFINSVTASPSGVNWAVRATDPANPGVFQLIEAKPVAGSVSGLVVEGVVDGVTFNGFGQASLLGGAPMPAPVRYDFRGTPASDCADAGGKMRCLRVMVSPGGQARMCDPAIVAVGDTRTC